MLWAKEIDKHTLWVNCDEGHGQSWEQGSICGTLSDFDTCHVVKSCWEFHEKCQKSKLCEADLNSSLEIYDCYDHWTYFVRERKTFYWVILLSETFSDKQKGA